VFGGHNFPVADLEYHALYDPTKSTTFHNDTKICDPDITGVPTGYYCHETVSFAGMTMPDVTIGVLPPNDDYTDAPGIMGMSPSHTNGSMPPRSLFYCLKSR